MQWLPDVYYFLGGIFLTNAVPHFVNGVSGRPFQSPFANPPGRGLSSSTANVIWGSINAVAGYALLCLTGGEFSFKNTNDIVALGLGIFLSALFLARYFGRFHGGNAPNKSDSPEGKA